MHSAYHIAVPPIAPPAALAACVNAATFARIVSASSYMSMWRVIAAVLPLLATAAVPSCPSLMTMDEDGAFSTHSNILDIEPAGSSCTADVFCESTFHLATMSDTRGCETTCAQVRLPRAVWHGAPKVPSEHGQLVPYHGRATTSFAAGTPRAWYADTDPAIALMGELARGVSAPQFSSYAIGTM